MLSRCRRVSYELPSDQNVPRAQIDTQNLQARQLLRSAQGTSADSGTPVGYEVSHSSPPVLPAAAWDAGCLHSSRMLGVSSCVVWRRRSEKWFSTCGCVLVPGRSFIIIFLEREGKSGKIELCMWGDLLATSAYMSLVSLPLRFPSLLAVREGGVCVCVCVGTNNRVTC